jgi:transcriptional regulator with XRE-family HTH domain
MTGERIRAARLARGWTRAELARRVGVTQGGISGVERGRHGTVNRRLMARLMEVLDLTPTASVEPGEDAAPGACTPCCGATGAQG